MDEWHVFDSITGNHLVVENQLLLWRYLNTLSSTAGVVVKHYQKIHKDTQAYGQVPGASPLPPNPANPPPSESVTITHIRPAKA
ncbi:MAG: hypothetical protein ACYCSN_19815 [Acidobacteriaceae bacterium]